MLVYALSPSEALVHIDEVANGLACGCRCPSCGESLIARNGGERVTHHFAHHAGVDCPGAIESALHLRAKAALRHGDRLEITAEWERVPRFFPEFGSTSLHAPDARQPVMTVPAEMLVIESVALEQRLGRIVPDLIARGRLEGSGEACTWLIEIAVTHPVDETKRAWIIEQELRVLEVDFAAREQGLEDTELRARILSPGPQRAVIHHPRRRAAHAEIAALEAENTAELRRRQAQLAEQEASDLEALRERLLALPLRVAFGWGIVRYLSNPDDYDFKAYTLFDEALSHHCTVDLPAGVVEFQRVRLADGTFIGDALLLVGRTRVQRVRFGTLAEHHRVVRETLRRLPWLRQYRYALVQTQLAALRALPSRFTLLEGQITRLYFPRSGSDELRHWLLDELRHSNRNVEVQLRPGVYRLNGVRLEGGAQAVTGYVDVGPRGVERAWASMNRERSEIEQAVRERRERFEAWRRAQARG